MKGSERNVRDKGNKGIEEAWEQGALPFTDQIPEQYYIPPHQRRIGAVKVYCDRHGKESRLLIELSGLKLHFNYGSEGGYWELLRNLTGENPGLDDVSSNHMLAFVAEWSAEGVILCAGNQIPRLP